MPLDDENRRIHERMDQLVSAVGALTIKIEVLIAREIMRGEPGKADACRLHRRDLDGYAHCLDDQGKRIGVLERYNVRVTGFLAGVAFMGGLAGSTITVLAGIILKKFGIGI